MKNNIINFSLICFFLVHLPAQEEADKGAQKSELSTNALKLSASHTKKISYSIDFVYSPKANPDHIIRKEIIINPPFVREVARQADGKINVTYYYKNNSIFISKDGKEAFISVNNFGDEGFLFESVDWVKPNYFKGEAILYNMKSNYYVQSGADSGTSEAWFDASSGYPLAFRLSSTGISGKYTFDYSNTDFELPESIKVAMKKIEEQKEFIRKRSMPLSESLKDK